MSIHFIISGAVKIQNITHSLFIERDTEYKLCLHKIFHYKKPVHAIISECTKEESKETSFSKFSFSSELYIPSTKDLNAKGKSEQEFLSIQGYVKNTTIFNDEDWIIKVSGRYLLLSDIFMNTVKNAPKECDAIVKLTDTINQICTFCFALRWKHFKDLYLHDVNDITKVGEKCIEDFVYYYIVHNKLKAIVVPKLDILTNINSEGIYRIY
jgi:hypothetical protein